MKTVIVVKFVRHIGCGINELIDHAFEQLNRSVTSINFTVYLMIS
jgi:hypothetical protein